MIQEEKVRAALIQAAVEFLTGSETIDTSEGEITGLPFISEKNISFENRKLDQPGKQVWASVFYRPNIPESRTIGYNGKDQISGFLQIDINTPIHTGEQENIKWGSKSRVFFHPGRKISYLSQKVLVKSSGMSQNRTVNNFYRTSITISFTSELKRFKIN